MIIDKLILDNKEDRNDTSLNIRLSDLKEINEMQGKGRRIVDLSKEAPLGQQFIHRECSNTVPTCYRHTKANLRT